MHQSVACQPRKKKNDQRRRARRSAPGAAESVCPQPHSFRHFEKKNKNKKKPSGFNHRHRFSELAAMLSSVPARLIARRSRSLSPSTRVPQTDVNAPTCQGIRETRVDVHRNTVVSPSRVSTRGILDDKTAGANVNSLVQYPHFAPKWLSKLDNRRRSWAALASRGRNQKQHWGESPGASGAGLPSVGLLSAAVAAFCLNKDSDNKGRPSFFFFFYCLTCYHK